MLDAVHTLAVQTRYVVRCVTEWFGRLSPSAFLASMQGTRTEETAVLPSDGLDGSLSVTCDDFLGETQSAQQPLRPNYALELWHAGTTTQAKLLLLERYTATMNKVVAADQQLTSIETAGQRHSFPAACYSAVRTFAFSIMYPSTLSHMA